VIARQPNKNTNQDHNCRLASLPLLSTKVALIKSNTEQQRNIISKTAAAAAAH